MQAASARQVRHERRQLWVLPVLYGPIRAGLGGGLEQALVGPEGWCHRFPETITKSATSWCGEFGVRTGCHAGSLCFHE